MEKVGSKEQFLDTKGACFLCLRETSIDTDCDGTNNHCQMKKVCLQNICRYLGISSCDTLSSDFKRETLNDNEGTYSILHNDTNNFSVTLCLPCSSKTQKLTDLIAQMEILRLQINHQLQVFHKSLIEAEEDGVEPFQNSRWADVKEKMISSSSSQREIQLVERFRCLAKDKGASKIKRLQSNSLPKVLLGPVGPVGPLREENNREIPDLKISSVCSLTDSVDKQEIENVKEEYSVAENNMQEETLESKFLKSFKKFHPEPLSPTFSNSSTTPLYDEPKCKFSRRKFFDIFMRFRIRDAQDGKRFRCTLCTRSTTFEAPQYRHHFISFHPDMLFAREKPPTQSDELFRDRCREMFLTLTKDAYTHAREMMKLENIPRPQNRKNSTCWCTVCCRYLTHGTSFRYHLVMEHYTLCVVKLNCIQEEKREIQMRETKLKESLQASRLTDSNEKDQHFPEDSCAITTHQNPGPSGIVSATSFICRVEDGGCGKAFPKKYNLQDHQRRSCPFRKNKKTYVCNLNEDGCGKVFIYNYNLQLHKKYHCPNNMNRDNPSFICDPATGGCGRTFTARKNLQKHKLLVCHLRVRNTPEEVQKIQSQSEKVWICDLSDGGCGKQVATKKSLARHQEQFCPTKVAKGMWICRKEDGGCSARCTSEIGLRRHIQKKCIFRSKNKKCDVVKKVKAKRVNVQDTVNFVIKAVNVANNPDQDPLKIGAVEYQHETTTGEVPIVIGGEPESQVGMNVTEDFTESNNMLFVAETVKMFDLKYETEATVVSDMDIGECIFPDI